MPQTSSKNTPLSSAGADLGLTGNTPAMDEETEEEKKKRLALQQKQQMSGNPMSSMAGTMLNLSGGDFGMGG
jgi:hypothetical protein